MEHLTHRELITEAQSRLLRAPYGHPAFPDVRRALDLFEFVLDSDPNHWGVAAHRCYLIVALGKLV